MMRLQGESLPGTVGYRSGMFEEIASGGPEAARHKRMSLRYAGTCSLCGAGLPARTEALYERATKTVRCIACPATGGATINVASRPETPGPQPLGSAGSGTAGSSARREYERRKAKDEARLRARWGRLGGLAVFMSPERQSTKAWERGAVGEERLGARLDSLVSDDIAVLHDRRIPGTRANIDHVVVTRAGIWVIDAKRYKGRPTLKIDGGILRPRTEKVLVGRRDCTELVDGVLRQVDRVREVAGDVPITGALCFVEADWPAMGGAFTSRGVHVLWPKRLAGMLTKSQTETVDVLAVRDSLASRFKSASPR